MGFEGFSEDQCPESVEKTERESYLASSYREFLGDYLEEISSDPELYSPLLNQAVAFVETLRKRVREQAA